MRKLFIFPVSIHICFQKSTTGFRRHIKIKSFSTTSTGRYSGRYIASNPARLNKFERDEGPAVSGDAFRQAVCRNSVPVPLFSIANRRGKFALAKEVASWLAQQRLMNPYEKTEHE